MLTTSRRQRGGTGGRVDGESLPSSAAAAAAIATEAAATDVGADATLVGQKYTWNKNACGRSFRALGRLRLGPRSSSPAAASASFLNASDTLHTFPARPAGVRLPVFRRRIFSTGYPAAAAQSCIVSWIDTWPRSSRTCTQPLFSSTRYERAETQ